MTKLGFIRHGSTHWNKERRAQGNSDIPLDHDGLKDAAKLAERLNKEEWDYIYSSDLLRAKQTAEIIADKLQVKLRFDARLREVGGGQIEGTTEVERVEKWGREWRKLDLGMESMESVLVRALAFIEEITKKHPDKYVLIVSHGSFIRHLLSELTADLKFDEHLTNTSVSTISMAGNVWECELYNCTKHLGNN